MTYSPSLQEQIQAILNALSNSQLQQCLESLQVDSLTQINLGNANGYQVKVEGGTAYIGDLHVDANLLETVLSKLLDNRLAKSAYAGTPNNLPRSGVFEFIGRTAELETLHQQLQKGDLVAISAIAGMGGVGKTELAIQYAKVYESAYSGGICWLFARELNIATQIVGYALVHLGLRIPDSLEATDQVAYCWRNWPVGDVLLVLDDVTDYATIKSYLPPQQARFKVLMTTRLKFDPPIQSIPLGVLTPEASLELLAALSGQERITQEREAAQFLCEWLGHLPLGLELVGRYLRLMDDLSLADVLIRLQQKAKEREALRDPALVRDKDDPTWTLTAQRGVESAFELSWSILDKSSQDLGKLLSLFALAPIPWEKAERVKQKHYEICPETMQLQSDDLRAARAKLLRQHLLIQVDQGSYRLHSLIREFFRGKLERRESDFTT